jgi:hypothetical protein
MRNEELRGSPARLGWLADSSQSLLAVAPTRHLAVLVEVDDSHPGPVTKIERDERFAHVQIIDPGFASIRFLDIIRLAKQLDDLVFGQLSEGIRNETGICLGKFEESYAWSGWLDRNTIAENLLMIAKLKKGRPLGLPEGIAICFVGITYGKIHLHSRALLPAAA